MKLSLLLLFPWVVWAQSTQPTSAPAGPKGPPRSLAPTSAPASLPVSQAAESRVVEAATQPVSQPVVLAVPDAVAASEGRAPLEEKRVLSEKGIDESMRLQGIWRSTRDPLGDYRLRGALEEKSPRRARRRALGLTLAGYGLLALGGGLYDAGDLGAGGAPSLSTISLVLGVGLVSIGPSAGHLYAGEPLHVVRYSLRRAFGAALVGVGISGVALVRQGSSSGAVGDPIVALSTLAGLAVAPVGILGVWSLGRGSIKEIRDAKYAALRHNAALKLQQTKLSVRSGQGSVSVGAALSW